MIPAKLLGRSKRTQQTRIQNLSRREFLKQLAQLGIASSGLVLGLNACGDDADVQPAKPDAGGGMDAGTDASMRVNDAGKPAQKVDAAVNVDYTDLDTFVAIGSDGSIRITVHRSEMGQGVRTSLAMLVADELGANWDDVKVIQAGAMAIKTPMAAPASA